MPYLLRRFIETLVIILLSSFPIYVIAKLEVLPDMRSAYLVLYGISSIIFLVLTFFVLRAYLATVRNLRLYLITNTMLLLIQVVLWIAALLFFSDDLYTAFFGYTKVFRAFDLSPAVSGIIIYTIYFIMMIYMAYDFKKWERYNLDA